MVTMLNFRFQNAHRVTGDMMVAMSIFLILSVYYVLFPRGMISIIATIPKYGNTGQKAHHIIETDLPKSASCLNTLENHPYSVALC